MECGEAREIGMALQVRRASSRKVRVISTLIAVFALVAQPLYGLMSSQTASAAGPVFPSTNAQNITNGWANVTQQSVAGGSTTLKFSSTRSFASCFEYRTDGDVTQKTSPNNFNTEITDGLYPYVCVNNSSQTRTINASQYVEVRQSFGAEKNERFDWTRFDVLPVNTAPSVAFVDPTPAEGSYIHGNLMPHVIAIDDYGMGSYYIRVWKNAFESGASNLVYNGCYAAPGALLLGTSQDITCSTIDTTTLSDGKYVLSAQFLDGNNQWGQSLRTFYVDNTAPTITVKPAPDTTGSITDKTFKKVSFKLHDNIKFEGKYTINGVESVITPSTWGDANNITVGQRGAKYGDNIITLKDLAGNSTSYSFILDNVEPTVTVKDGFVGDKDLGIFSNVSFSLYDLYKVDKYVINGYTSDFSNNKWSDANFQNIKSHLTQGTNTFVLYDIVGNSKTFIFTYDTNAPTGEVELSNTGNPTNENVTATLKTNEDITTPTDWTKVNNREFTREHGTNGDYSVEFKDLAGNPETVNYTVQGIDKELPVVDVNNVVRNSNGTYTITGMVSDEVGVSQVLVSLDGGTIKPVTTLVGDVWTFTTPILLDGPHTLTVTSRDTAGNEGTLVTSPYEFIAATPPAGPPASPGLPGTPQGAAATGNSLINTTTSQTVNQSEENDEESILGAQTTKNTPATTTAAIEATPSGWSIFGLAWYWWLLILAALAAGIWWLIAARRRNSEEA